MILYKQITQNDLILCKSCVIIVIDITYNIIGVD